MPSAPDALAPIDEVLADVQAGKMVIMVDNPDRENEGDLVVATEKITASQIAFMAREARGLICVTLSRELSARLRIPYQVLQNASRFRTPFGISVDHRETQAIGVTAQSRAFTMQRMIAADAMADEFVSPGSVFPLIVHEKGVLGRRGQTEGSYDLVRMAGLSPSGVICEILGEDGEVLRGEALRDFATRFDLKITSVEEVLRYRILREGGVRMAAQSQLSTDVGEWTTYVFEDDVLDKEHLALVCGDIRTGAVLARVHSECLTGDVFESRRCDCGPQLHLAMKLIQEEGAGIILYLRQEGRGIGLANKLKAYLLQDEGHDTVEANIRLGFPPDVRDFVVAANILRELGVHNIRLLTNNPQKVGTLRESGINVVERIPLLVPVDEESRSYLETKRVKMGHLLGECDS